jgi:hypothetical protein
MYCPGCGKEMAEGFAGLACPFCGANLKSDGPVRGAASGIPWEQRGTIGFLPALTQNIKACLFDPSAFFSAMPKRENLGSALGYVLLLGWIGGLGGLLWDRVSQGFWRQALQNLGVPASEPPIDAAMMGVIYVGYAVLLPLFIAIAVFIISGILHVSLWIVGGANEGFEATVRTYAYAAGSTSLFQWIPFCGGLIGLIWCLVLQVYGFSRVHEISGGKAALAVFLPVVLCCMLLVAGILLFATFFAAMFQGLSA